VYTNWLHDLARTSLGDFNTSSELDARLSALALRARTDDSASFELLGLLAWKIERFLRRFRAWDLAPFDLDDVAQEAYLAYLDTLRRWRPRYVAGRAAGYLYYFLSVFPHWVANRVRRWRRPARPSVVRHIQTPVGAAVPDTALLSDFCRNLSPQESTLVQLRIVRGLSIPHAATTMGIARRTAYRRWSHILEVGREFLREAG
jgi:DNA-directed RNA polymerase specialized sigma24 family protein